MKKIFLCSAIVLFVAGFTIGAGQKVGDIGNIDTGKNEVTVNIKSGAAVKMGDMLEVLVDNKSVMLEVKYPMQTVAICKIKGKGKLSDLMNGLAVYRYGKGSAETALKTGDTKMIGSMEFVYIEAGTFKMGSEWPTGEDCERPVHDVTLDGFWMGKYEVTQKQYEEIMEENPSRHKKENFAVDNIRWKDADNFCKEFSAKFNVKSRLPSEAEWEYACRAGSTTKYYWGDKMDGDYCWNFDNADGKLHPGGKKKPNAFGLYDMSGNVREWCLDWYDEEFYSKSPARNPVCKKKSSGLRVSRGGSIAGLSDGYIRSGNRYRKLPDLDSKSYQLNGFRVVVEQ